MSLVLLVASFIAIVLYEAPEMIRREERGELALFAGLVLLGFVVSLLQTVGVAVPNPVKGIEFLTSRIAAMFR